MANSEMIGGDRKWSPRGHRTIVTNDARVVLTGKLFISGVGSDSSTNWATTTAQNAEFDVKLLFYIPASWYARDTGSARSAWPRHWQTERRGNGQEVRIRGWLLLRWLVMVAKDQAKDLVHVRWALLFFHGQGTVHSNYVPMFFTVLSQLYQWGLK